MTAIEHAARPMPVQFDAEQLELIKHQIAQGVTDGELALFVQQAKRTGLDPFSRQIYAVVREENKKDERGQWTKTKKMTIQVAIDGFRLIAERTGKYAGQVGPQWCGTDGKWVDVWLSDKPPAAARVGVLRSDFKEPLWGVARFDAYASRKKDGELMGLWAKMPDVMVAKCAEAQALRRAFPNDLSGLYTGEEMEQAEQTAAPVVQERGPRADVTGQVRQAAGLPEQAAQPSEAQVAWYQKVRETEERVAGIAPEGEVVAIAADMHAFSSVAEMKGYYEALKALGMKYAPKPAQEEVKSDIPAEEPAPWEGSETAEAMATDQQVKALGPMGSSAGALQSADRAVLWGYLLNMPDGVPTKALTEAQATVLIDTMTSLSPEERRATYEEAKKAKKGVLL